MAKVITPRDLSKGARLAFSNPKHLNRIFHESLKEDLIKTSKSLDKEFQSSPGVLTAKKAKETREYSKMLTSILDDDEKNEPTFAESLFNLTNIEKKTSQSMPSSSSGFIMNNSQFFVKNDDFSQCFDDHSHSKRQSKHQQVLLDDDDSELSDMFDRLSTSESEG